MGLNVGQTETTSPVSLAAGCCGIIQEIIEELLWGFERLRPAVDSRLMDLKGNFGHIRNRQSRTIVIITHD